MTSTHFKIRWDTGGGAVFDTVYWLPVGAEKGKSRGAYIARCIRFGRDNGAKAVALDVLDTGEWMPLPKTER